MKPEKSDSPERKHTLTTSTTSTANPHEDILAYIDNYLDPWQFYEILQFKTDIVIELISFIMKESGKTIPEAVLVFLALVKSRWDGTGDLLEFIKENSEPLCRAAVREKAQGNLPGRALPLFDIFAVKMPGQPVSVIELGASYGLIGRCLLNPAKIREGKQAYFPATQQMPRLMETSPVRQYLGIELSPPTREWVLAWEWMPERKKRLATFLEEITAAENFRLLKENAFGFAALDEVKAMITHETVIVVLTSFMLYQLEPAKQERLRREIREFLKNVNGHWINQTFNPTTMACFIEFDEERIINLSDDGSRSWQWLI